MISAPFPSQGGRRPEIGHRVHHPQQGVHRHHHQQAHQHEAEDRGPRRGDPAPRVQSVLCPPARSFSVSLFFFFPNRLFLGFIRTIHSMHFVCLWGASFWGHMATNIPSRPPNLEPSVEITADPNSDVEPLCPRDLGPGCHGTGVSASNYRSGARSVPTSPTTHSTSTLPRTAPIRRWGREVTPFLRRQGCHGRYVMPAVGGTAAGHP